MWLGCEVEGYDERVRKLGMPWTGMKGGEGRGLEVAVAEGEESRVAEAGGTAGLAIMAVRVVSVECFTCEPGGSFCIFMFCSLLTLSMWMPISMVSATSAGHKRVSWQGPTVKGA